VKSGKSQLSKVEKSLKKTIENKKVSWEEYRIPEDLTRKRDD
jgi:predicted Holliday junction resolvase-like endonuclease